MEDWGKIAKAVLCVYAQFTLTPPLPRIFWVTFHPTQQLVDVMFKAALTYANQRHVPSKKKLNWIS